jgi:hypothetical protein
LRTRIFRAVDHPVDGGPVLDVLGKLKLAIRARAGNRAGLLLDASGAFHVAGVFKSV